MNNKIIFKIIGLTIFFLFLIQSCKTKNNVADLKTIQEVNYIPYYLKVYEADSLFIIGNYDRSYEILDSLFKKFEPIDMDIYYEYKTYLVCKHKIKKHIEKREFELLILEFGYDNTQIMNDENLKDTFIKLVSDTDYTNLRNQYLNSLDIALRKEIISMKGQDQKFRMGKRSSEDIKNQNKIDSVNTLKMMDIFEKIGFPGRNVIGGFNIDDTPVSCNVILLHTKDSIRLSYFAPKIKEFINNGTASPILYGSLIDQYFIYKGQEQFYGTYQNSPMSNTKISELNMRRKDIGLPDYNYENWRLEQLYPEQFELIKNK